MNNYRILFFQPRSTASSILGVLLKMLLLVLPFALMALFFAQNENVNWLWLLAGLIPAFILFRLSETFIHPLIGRRHEFIFEKDRVLIRRGGAEQESVLRSALVALDAFEVPAESGTVKHIVMVLPGGEKFDIFDTWVTSASSGDFDKAYTVILQKGF